MFPCVIWFIGLSGSGKTTLSDALFEKLKQKYSSTLIKKLDGDLLRNGLNNNLGFSLEDRTENIRRSVEVAKLFYETGFVVLASFITPTHQNQQLLTDIFDKKRGALFKIFIDCPLEICEQRDVKGLYKKARTGAIKEFTGISSPFEKPSSSEVDLIIDSSKLTINESIVLILDKLEEKGFLQKKYFTSAINNE
ncbi:adenylylsulfate kinase ApsK [Bernardetia litoralis DSM 6794]|uniref:Adenylyl-sulfate kinase n=1 Tax=Bernardetia litoralis (strain ATCC 23117 / DSM 6794 / NBRC 15988 / NCIMB 1366 / Fx l1 / Sio-4) TaxID=880071 RepID=I4AHB0_BERLS|nr:adenylyl-sulfate kinase [Bernardetia litoralis]AFM03345.1 adenylylsulfate kinase ApsK [Bernardetia litoralis DSM 6794]